MSVPLSDTDTTTGTILLGHKQCRIHTSDPSELHIIILIPPKLKVLK